MEEIPNHPLVKITKEVVETTRRFHNVSDVRRINEGLDAIEEWIKKQDHLLEARKYMSREYLERIYSLANFSTESAKKKIDKLLTIRTLLPEICLNKSPSEFKTFFDSQKYLPLPTVSPNDNTRVIVIQLIPEKIDDFSLLSFCRYGNMVGEYRLHYDYSLGERYIIDMKQESIVTKINPILLKKIDAVAETYGTKIKGIHILNAPPFVDAFVRLIKQTLRQTVASRLHVHKSYDELYEHIPRKILPIDFGGDELSVEELCEQWKSHLNTDEAIKLIAESNKIISDENKRNTASFNEEYMGMPGSFRQLSVD